MRRSPARFKRRLTFASALPPLRSVSSEARNRVGAAAQVSDFQPSEDATTIIFHLPDGPIDLLHMAPETMTPEIVPCRGELGKNIADHLAVDVGQAIVAALKAEGQALVVETQEMQ